MNAIAQMNASLRARRRLVDRLRNEFLPAILHGDDEHQEWLREAVEAFIAHKPIPAPRGKGAA